MADKAAKTHTHKSNRASAKGADPAERRTVFKSVLDNPYKISWPSVPVNIQNLALAKLMILLDGVSAYNTAKSTENRKRKRAEKLQEKDSAKRQKLESHNAESKEPSATQPPTVPDQVTPEHYETQLVPPPMISHITIGINEVTKRLETQAQPTRSTVTADADSDEANAAVIAPIRVVFVCRDDVNPLTLINHLPHLAAAVNSIPNAPTVKLIPLPKGSESSLAHTIGMRRAAVIAFDDSTLELTALMPLFESVPVLVAPWLTPAAQNVPVIPTHIKQVRTSAPKDMKKHKDKRAEEKKEAKERRSKSKRAKTREVIRAVDKSA